MALTEAQRERRRKYVGGSDIAAIMGVDTYRSRADVWAEKVQGVSDFKSDAANLGNHLEVACKTLAAEFLGKEVTSANPFRRVADSPIGVLLDAWYDEGGVAIPVECKTSGLLNPWGPGVLEWGAEGTDEVPSKYILQVHGQMMATGASYSHISALIPGRGHAMYKIGLDAEIANLILEQTREFWGYVESKIAPPDIIPSHDILKRLERLPKSVIELGGDVFQKVTNWQAMAAEKRDAEKRYEHAQDDLIMMLGAAESAIIEWPEEHALALAQVLDLVDDPDDKKNARSAVQKAAEKRFITYLEQSKTSIDAKKLQARFPEAFEETKSISTFRVLRIGKLKKGVEVNMDAGAYELRDGTPLGGAVEDVDASEEGGYDS